VTESDLTAAAAVRASLGIGHGATVIGGVGTLGWCKGSDLFVQVARSVLGGSRAPGAHFVWIGADPTGRELERHRHDVARLGLEGRVHFVGPTARPEAYHDSFDLLLLTSRDDACPVVVLEAGQRGVPTVCFAQSGGAPEFADKDAGVVVPYLDVAAMGKAVKGLIRDDGRRRALGEGARDKVLEVHDVDVVGPLLLERIHTHLAQGAAAPALETRAVRVADGEPPGIEPVADGTPRPFWTVAVPTHRPPPLLKSTLESVLAQDPGPEAMQILVVDDGSGDDRARVLVEQLAPDRIEYIGNPTSLGIARSWNSCLAASRGEWIHLLHQDDLVRPGFYAALAAGVRERPEVGAAFCRHFVTDDAGHWQGISPLERPSPGMLEGWLARLASGQCIQCPAIVVRRSVYEKLGGFRPDLIYALDWEMWLRIARTEKFWYEPEPLAAYRCHAANESSRLQRTGDTVADVRRAARVATQSLAPALRRDALRYCTRHALETAGRSFARADHAGAWAQLRAAFREDRSPWFWWQLARATWAGLAGRLRRRR
jgi:GT2 family glycosyltransferase